MKKRLLVTIVALELTALLFTGGLVSNFTHVQAQASHYPGFRVIGRHLYDRYGEKVILYGVNKMVIWTDRDGLPSFPEIAKTGANVVRIVWLTEGSAKELDTAITNAIGHRLIPMVDCHDSTGKWELLQTCVDYWVRTDILEVIKKHESYLLINIANEAGQGSPGDLEYRAAYELAVRRMRAAGIHVPLIIDAAGYGQDIDILQSTGPYLIQADPDHNLMFSIHMWWPSAWRGAQVAQLVFDEIAESVAMELPLIIGEFADNGPGCTCCIPYQTIIEQAHLNEVGYLAWSWGPGNRDCASMDMTEDGTFETLRGWGLEVAMTSPHSIRAIAVRPQWLAAMTPAPTPTPEPTPTPLPAPTGLISQGKRVEASSLENDALTAENAVDGNLNSRWASAYADPQSITIDLGEAREIARIVLKWEAAYGREYKLQVSDDNATWTDVVHETSGNGGEDDHLVQARGRYVRMLGLKRGTEYGYSLWEFWVFDRPDAELPTPDATGAVSASVDTRPDLVITDVAWEPDPIVGKVPVLFSATVTNQGYSSTRLNTPIRVSFAISGTIVSWSGSYSRALTSGESIVLTADSGPEGNSAWVPNELGEFIVLAWVDDPALSQEPLSVTGDIVEKAEFNNLYTKAGLVRITAPPPTPTRRPTATSTPTETSSTSESDFAAQPTSSGAEQPMAAQEPTASPLAAPLILGLVLLGLILVGVALRRVVRRSDRE